MSDIERSIQRASELCAIQRARFTPLRERVLRTILASGNAVRAYEIIEELSTDEHAIKPPSVYRSLHFLMQQGLVHRVESANGYVACEHPHRPHDSVLLRCSHCGRVEEIDGGDLATTIRGAASRHGFEPAQVVLESVGRCRRCRD